MNEKIEIFTELTNKEIEEALVGDIYKLWNVFSGLEGNEEFQIEMNKIKYGYDINFDIRAIIDGFIEYRLKGSEVRIEKNIDIDITDFRDERDKRIKSMKDIIRILYDDSFDGQEEEAMEEYDNHGQR